MLKDPLSPRLLKKVQMQGGMRKAERGVLQVRRNECLSVPTQQMGLFEQPAQTALATASIVLKGLHPKSLMK